MNSWIHDLEPVRASENIRIILPKYLYVSGVKFTELDLEKFPLWYENGL